MVDLVILADDLTHQGEINILNHLVQVLGFEHNFILHAQNLDFEEGLAMLSEMSQAKKIRLKEILYSVAQSDGFVHEKEAALITTILSSIGLTNITKDQ